MTYCTCFIFFRIQYYRYRLYIRRELKSDSAWMFKMFDRTVCYLMLIMFLGLSGLGYTIQKISSKVSRDKQLGHSLQDHFFYTFGTLCSQGFIPDSLYHRIKIFGLTKKLFAWLFLVIISSHLISYMTNRKFEPPFEDLKTLFKTTQYNLIVFKGMLVFDKFKVEPHKFMSTNSWGYIILAARKVHDFSKKFQEW